MDMIHERKTLITWTLLKLKTSDLWKAPPRISETIRDLRKIYWAHIWLSPYIQNIQKITLKILQKWKKKRKIGKRYEQFSTFQFSHSVMSDSLQPHELQHARPPCLLPTPGIHPNPCLLSPWCHPTISSSVVPFSCPQSFPASGSFPMSQFFTSGGQSIWVSASTSVLPMNTQDWFLLGWTAWIDTAPNKVYKWLISI